MLSGGRLIFGIGVGYLKPEFDALGVSFAHKGARTEEYLRAMIAIWTMDQPRFEGRFASFAGVQARPRPVQKPHPEIVFGGHTPEAYSRAARLAKGWYGFALDVESTKKSIAGLRGGVRQPEPAIRRSRDQRHARAGARALGPRSGRRGALRRGRRAATDPLRAARERRGELARTDRRSEERADRQGLNRAYKSFN